MSKENNAVNNQVNETDTKKKGIQIDWLEGFEIAGQIMTGVCAAFGAVGLISFGWDQLHKPKVKTDDILKTDI